MSNPIASEKEPLCRNCGGTKEEPLLDDEEVPCKSHFKFPTSDPSGKGARGWFLELTDVPAGLHGLADMEALYDVMDRFVAFREQRLFNGLPDYWKEAIGGAHKVVTLRKHSASHPNAVKRMMAQHAGTETADVIAALAFQSCVAWEGHGLLGDQVNEQQTELASLRQQLRDSQELLDKVREEIKGDANFGATVELLFYGPLREKESELREAQGKVSQLEAEHVAIAKALMVVFDGDCWEVGFENKDDGFPTLSAACKAIYEDSDAMQKRADKAESQVSVLTKERDEALEVTWKPAALKWQKLAQEAESRLSAVSEVVRTLKLSKTRFEILAGRMLACDLDQGLGEDMSHEVSRDEIPAWIEDIDTALTNYEKAQQNSPAVSE